MEAKYYPEGHLLHSIENQTACSSVQGLKNAMNKETVLEGIVILCGENHDLTVSLGPFTGTIPREEGALGIAEGTTRDIALLSLVGKPVSFLVTDLLESGGSCTPILSRRRAQELALRKLLATVSPGDILPATVTHLEPFGAFVDIGCGLPSMIGVDRISISRIPHPKYRLRVGQKLYVAVLGIDHEKKHLLLTHRELLGTWEENAALFHPNTAVAGTVRGIQEYGAFIELTPNLSGLAEQVEDLQDGDRVSVYIKSILPERMKIKLLIIDRLPSMPSPEPFRYFITQGRLDTWRYAPDGCKRSTGETRFNKTLSSPHP